MFRQIDQVTAEPELDDTELTRVLLAAYEQVRLTENASTFLDRCSEAAQADMLNAKRVIRPGGTAHGRERSRSAISGRFVKLSTAKKNPKRP